MNGGMDGWMKAKFLLLFALNTWGCPPQEHLLVQLWTRSSEYKSETALSMSPVESHPGGQDSHLLDADQRLHCPLGD